MPRCWAFALALLTALVAVSDPGAGGAPRRGRTTRAHVAKPAPSEPQKRAYRVAAIGDSLTAARSHGGKYLDYLRKKCPESRFDNYGKGGETVQQMRRRFAREGWASPAVAERRSPSRMNSGCCGLPKR